MRYPCAFILCAISLIYSCSAIEQEQITDESQEIIKIEKLAFESSSIEMGVNEEVQLTVIIYPEDATERGLTWSSSSPEVASVDDNGIVKSKSVGTTLITVQGRHPLISSRCTVTVTEPVIEFEDPIVHNMCVSHWDKNGDHGLSYAEAAAITTLGGIFKESGETPHIERFNELKYFTGLKSIDDNEFYYCTQLKEITLPDTIESIGKTAFYGCVSLTNLTIPETVSYIGEGAFAFCEGLESISLPEGITSILKGTFSGCRSLKTISIPDSVREIEINSFCRCIQLQEITLPNNLYRIGGGAFKECSSLLQIELPESLSIIEDFAFDVCEALQRVTILSKLEYVGDRVFWRCPSILCFSGNYASDDSRCFIFDGTLKGFAPNGIPHYSFPDEVRNIEGQSFYGYKELESITLPETLESIGCYAFCENEKLTVIKCLAPEPPKLPDGSPFDLQTVPLSTIYVPINSIENYKNAEYWKYYSSLYSAIE